MSVSLSALCNKVLGESGFQIPTGYFSSLSPDDVQMAYIANAASDDIREKAPQIIRKTGTVVLTSATAYDLPSDFLAYVPDTAYTEGRLDPVLLPVAASQWNEWLANSNPGGIQVRARFLAGQLQIIQPEVGTTITYEYVSNAPWTDADGTTSLEQATADTDLCLIDRRLMETAIKWRWKKEKGLADWQIDRAEYLNQLNTWRARDGGSRTLQFGEPAWPMSEPYTNLWVP